MRDWNRKEIASTRSKGGVIAVAHPFDNLIHTGCCPWPSPEILQKLYRSRQARAFSKEALAICTSGIGYYCDLQSLHSEDAITWSVFGTVAQASQADLGPWFADLCAVLNLPGIQTQEAKVFLWRRIPHPETQGSTGPEIDVGISTENAFILGEAKWKARIATGQGKEKDKDQIQLRGEFLANYGAKLFPNHFRFAVFGISLAPDRIVDTTPPGVPFRSITWSDVCKLDSHPLADEVRRYFSWKKENTQAPHGISYEHKV